MLGRVLFVSDLHKSDSDMSSIKGRMEVQQLIQQDIIDAVKKFGVTHIVIMGDWYHRGFHSTGATISAHQEDINLSESVNGNVYICLGNHFFLERDDNPEMYVIQPNSKYIPKRTGCFPEKPIFQAVDDLVIGQVQISLFHFNKLNKDYCRETFPGILHHIGVYHDDTVVPTWVREQEGYAARASSSSYMSRIFENIEIAMLGHIHTKIGAIKYLLENGREVPMFIPGSLGITANSDRFKHTSVQLPILDIYEDGHYEIKLANFSTHLDKLKFYESKTGKKDLTQDQVMLNNDGALRHNASNLTLSAYMQQRGYPNLTLSFVDAAAKGTLGLMEAFRLVSEEAKHGEHSSTASEASE